VDDLRLADLRARRGSSADFSVEFPPFAALVADWLGLRHEIRRRCARVSAALSFPLRPFAPDALLSAPEIVSDEAAELLRLIADTGRVLRGER
jgi:hypothetical protein